MTVLAAALAAFLARPASAQAADPGPVVERIVFSGNRTDEAVLRRRLPFAEGVPLRPGDLARAREALYRMRLFKSVAVSSAAAGGGAEVRVDLGDGYYVIPFPFFAGGSGGSRGGLLLSGRNLFRQAESVNVLAMGARTGTRASLGGDWEGWRLDAAYERRDFTERAYADGGFSASPFLREPADENNPTRFAPVATSYEKKVDSAKFSAGVPILRRADYSPLVTASAGWGTDFVAYGQPAPAVPADAGRQGQAFVGLQAGAFGPTATDALGALLGYGLADLESRIKPLPAPVATHGASVVYNQGAPWTGSQFTYGYALARWNSSISWGTHHRLGFTAAGGRGDGLPANRLIASGPQTGLQGLYAREFRGDTALGGSLTYAHPFRITRRGIWQGVVFAEGARVWDGGAPRDKEGIGASVFYLFWRFPIPLGLSATYSFDDRDVQVSGAVGGRF